MSRIINKYLKAADLNNIDDRLQLADMLEEEGALEQAKVMRLMKDLWVWMPHPGHYISSHRCRFILNTYLPTGFIVSTVGEQMELGSEKPVEISSGATYETMVFTAAPQTNVNGRCCPWVVGSHRELECQRYNENEEAYKGHLALCEEWALVLEPPRREEEVDDDWSGGEGRI